MPQDVDSISIHRRVFFPGFGTILRVTLGVLLIWIGIIAAGRIYLWFNIAFKSQQPSLVWRAIEVTIRWSLFLVGAFTFYGLSVMLLRRAYVRLTVRGVVLAYCAFVAWFFGGVGLVLWVQLKKLPSGSDFIVSIVCGASGFGLLVVGTKLFKLARQNFSRSADELMELSRKPPILYLRSFAGDDQAAPANYSLDHRESSLSWRVSNPSFWTERREWSFEEVVCKGLDAIVPVVAMGQPGESLPRLGAARKYVDSDSWQSEVQRLMDKSLFVCLVIGRSDGLIWEFGQLLDRTDGRKALLIIPQSTQDESTWREFVELGNRFRSVPVLPPKLPHNALALTFYPGWRAVVFTGQPTINTYRQIGEWVARAQNSAQN